MRLASFYDLILPLQNHHCDYKAFSQLETALSISSFVAFVLFVALNQFLDPILLPSHSSSYDVADLERYDGGIFSLTGPLFSVSSLSVAFCVGGTAFG